MRAFAALCALGSPLMVCGPLAIGASAQDGGDGSIETFDLPEFAACDPDTPGDCANARITGSGLPAPSLVSALRSGKTLKIGLIPATRQTVVIVSDARHRVLSLRIVTAPPGAGRQVRIRNSRAGQATLVIAYSVSGGDRSGQVKRRFSRFVPRTPY